jgi:ABC-type lipoprotein release transport system permease subunit
MLLLQLLPLAYSWRNVAARKLATGVTLAGVSVAVMVFVVMTATADGIARVAVGTGEPGNLIVLSKGAPSAEASKLPRDVIHVVRHAPGVARDAEGDPLVSVEALMVHSIPRKGARARDFANSRYTVVRGVTPLAFAVHPHVRLHEGRLPRAPDEVVIGRLLPTKLGAVGLRDELVFAGRRHRIVGVFQAAGQIFEGEIWMRLDDLLNEMDQREVSVLVLRLEDPLAMPAVLEEIEGSKRVTVDVKPERAYYEDIQRASLTFVYLGNLIGALMGLGAVVAGMNTMYAAMSRRVREMGTLRALGFGRWQVGGALLLESVLVAALGGAIGIGLAFGFDGFGLNLLGLSFELDVQRDNVARGAILALAIGGLGGALPARAAARLEIVAALRHV